MFFDVIDPACSSNFQMRLVVSGGKELKTLGDVHDDEEMEASEDYDAMMKMMTDSSTTAWSEYKDGALRSPACCLSPGSAKRKAKVLRKTQDTLHCAIKKLQENEILSSSPSRPTVPVPSHPCPKSSPVQVSERDGDRHYNHFQTTAHH